jgi:hypothetical protein
MTTKRTTKKAPAEAGALRTLSGREIEAHASFGSAWGEGIIPRDETLAALARHGIGGDKAEAIINASWDHLGRYQMDANLIDKRLTPKEIVAQARMTAQIAHELNRRMRHMEPNIKAMASWEARRAWGERMVSLDFQDDLIRLEVLMKWVANYVDKRARKTVTKRTGPRNRLLAEIVSVVKLAWPDATKERTMEVAADLLRCWGVQAPSNERDQRRAANRGK